MIALGGGSVLSEQVREALRGHVTVLLDVDPDAAWERVAPGTAMEQSVRWREIVMRFALYMPNAGGCMRNWPTLSCRRRPGPPASLRWPRVLLACARCAALPAHAWCGRASASGEYPVLIGRGLLMGEGQADARGGAGGESGRSPLALAPVLRQRRDRFRLYAERLGEVAGMLAIAPGESTRRWPAPNASGVSCSAPA